MARQRTAGILPEMSFLEIGRELGISAQQVWILYKSAMRKLRRDPEVSRLQDLAECMRSESNQVHDTSV
jgi:DNA-directed RNA polymerase sigma subunit (sigma70/sigma32)